MVWKWLEITISILSQTGCLGLQVYICIQIVFEGEINV